MASSVSMDACATCSETCTGWTTSMACGREGRATECSSATTSHGTSAFGVAAARPECSLTAGS